MVVKEIIQEFKNSTFFYSLVIWIFIFAALATFDKFNNKNKFNLTEKDISQVVRDKWTNEDRMKDLEIKLNSIHPKPKYLHLDCGILEVLYTIIEFEGYSKLIWNSIIEHIDKFLKLISYSEIYPTHFLIGNLIAEKKEILNHMHSMVFNLPNNDYLAQQKLLHATKSIHYLLNFRIEQIRQKNNKIFNENINNLNFRLKFVEKQNITPYNVKQFKTANADIY